ncbi:MAG: NAD-glutamate dehydrogenase [Candidatus Wallbacteria bacterium]|nr:NAD-glutamate dehydrogenase [Candidatus Wallbacteria bacterium]
MESALQSTLDAAKNQLQPDELELFSSFVELYFPAIPKRYRSFLEGDDLTDFLLARWQFFKPRVEGSCNVRVYSPSSAQEAWNLNVSVLEARLEDRPFIVDSLKELLRTRGLEVLLTVHPVLAVDRDETGRLRSLASGRASGRREAYVYMHFDRLEAREDQEALERTTRDMLQMVCAAVDDYPHVRDAVRQVADELIESPDLYPGGRSTQEQKRHFFLWLLDGNFTCLAARRLERQGEGFVPIEGAIWGLFRRDRTPPGFVRTLEEELSATFEAALSREFTLTVTRIGLHSPVHRFDEMDYISIRKRRPDGTIGDVMEIVGLFTTSALLEKPTRIPLIKDKIALVLRTLGYLENSYSYKTAASILTSLPKEALFNSTEQDLVEEVDALMSAAEGEEVLISLRPKPEKNRMTVTIRMPDRNYSIPVRDRLLARLRDELQPAVMRDYHCFGEGEVSRLHIYMFGPRLPEDSRRLWQLGEELEDVVRTWQDRLLASIEEQWPGPASKELGRVYSNAFPATYQASNSVDSALWDIRNLEQLSLVAPIQVGIYRERHPAPGTPEVTEVRIYRREKVVLSEIMPILSNLGLMVIEERAAEVKLFAPGPAYIHSFHVRCTDGQPIPEDRMAPLSECLKRVRMGQADSDPLNGLVLTGGLSWQAADLFLAYRNLMMQVRRTSSTLAVNDALLKYSHVTRALFQLFEARFDPGLGASRHGALNSAREEAAKQLEKVDSINADRVLRSLRDLIEATVRTNFYLTVPDGLRSISLKIASGQLPDIPHPKPHCEIYVHAPGVEAVHLRGGKVARGGIRWSDRPDDFRTEILGLMKTQMVKNSVIVPVGSKGGFVLKKTFPDRKTLNEEMVRQYTVFMHGLLSLTDNIVQGSPVPPPDIVCHDDADPYLVVAADKGTANMSDTANSISKSFGFWLGDAFASGGSAGYSHKAMGITARGGWECVKRHFREMGIDLDTREITCVGIGDMSGDVFGNGMLLSRKLKLIAAFDHRHIFIDPDPDPEASLLERQRMFKLPTSSWADYNRELISVGGGVFSRGEKKIQLSSEARELIGIEAQTVNGEELIRCILRAKCDLLWNGGIGTYIKSSRETNLDVGDKANDEVRVNGAQVRALVVGEGGNLGATQLGRIEYARKGGRINTDAIDNSGGVDCSDHEVNLKILFKLLIEEGCVGDEEERNRILADLTDQVGAAVLQNNYLQSALLSMDESRSRTEVEPFIGLIDFLVKRGLVDRDKDHIPSDEELRSGRTLGQTIPRPVLALLTGWAKKVLYEQILEGPLPDRDYYRKFFIEYFPPSVWQRFGEACLRHHLRREIIATCLANRIVNQAGICFVHRLCQESGDEVAEVVRIYILVNDLLEGDRIRAEIHALDNKAPARLQYQQLLALEETIYAIGLRILRTKLQQEINKDVVSRYAPEVRELMLRMREHVSPDIRQKLIADEKSLEDQGFPHALAQELATIPFMKPVLTMVGIREQAQTSLEMVAGLWYRLGDELFLHYLASAVEQIPLHDDWDRELRDSVMRDLGRYHRNLTAQVLQTRDGQEGIGDTLDRFLRDRKKPYARLKVGVTRLKSSGAPGLIPVQVLKENYEEMLSK